MTLMANLTLVYGLRLLPEGEATEIHDATLKLTAALRLNAALWPLLVNY
jgi:hypothetical protein